MKIAIIGRGSVGVLALLNTLSFMRDHNLLGTHSISLVYDPKQPQFPVGEAVTWILPTLLSDLLGTTESLNVLQECGATFRSGTYFQWVGSNRNFEIKYDSPGVHFNSGELANSIIPRVMDLYDVNIIEEHVSIEGLKDRGYDKIISCMGSPTKEVLDSEAYTYPPLQTINSALLYQDTKYCSYDLFEYTGNTFHGNGWSFQIPLQNKRGIGYLFNSNLTSIRDAKRDFTDQLSTLGASVDSNELKYLEWEPYYRNTALEGDVLYLGNSLYLFEPAQAVPFHFFNSILRISLPTLLLNTGAKEVEEVNNIYSREVLKVLDLIAFNYVGDMGFKTAFWDTTKKLSKKYLEDSETFKKSLSQEPFTLSTHSPELIEQYIKGFKIKHPTEKHMEYNTTNNKNYKAIYDRHLPNETLEREKFRIYKSTTILENRDRLLNSCEIVRDNLVSYLNMEEGDKTTTWKHAEYNFWTHAMLVDPMFIKVWEELLQVIKECAPKEAEYAWVQSWMNFDSYSSVENNLPHHAHGCSIHGYVSIEPQDTKTVFDDWEIHNEVGNIYIGLGKWKHHVENLKEYAGPRATIGYDVVFGDLAWEDYTEEGYQSLPWHEHWIPVPLN